MNNEHAFVYGINEYEKRIGKGIKDKCLYIKFSFIYNADKPRVTVGMNRYEDLVIVPSKIIVDQISFHNSKSMKSPFDKL